MAKKQLVDASLYSKQSINDLIIFAMGSIMNDKKECSFEELVKKCFILFPKMFDLSGFPKWPDTRKLDRPLRDLRKRKMIERDPKSNFSLTKSGKKKALEIANFFRQGKLL